jgi:hypothetical protein
MRTGLLSRANAGGLSTIVATVGESGMPSCCRAVGVKVGDDEQTATVWVPVPTSQETITNLAVNPRIAVVLSEPQTHVTVQIKGISRSVRLATADEREHVARQMERFGAALDVIGLPRRVTNRINRWPAFAIELEIEHVFDQTPGPKAGREVR